MSDKPPIQCDAQRQIDCSREFGQIGARLANLEGQNEVLFAKLDKQTARVAELQTETVKHLTELRAAICAKRGLWKAITAALSAAAGFAAAWISHKD